MLLKPARSELAAVAIRAGLALADAVDALLGRPDTRLKWPNDALLGDRKLAGILCEGRWQGNTPQWLALGVGVNVRNAIPAAVTRGAVALVEWLPAVRRIDLLDGLVPALARTASGGGAGLSPVECTAFAARDWLRGRQLRTPAVGRAGGGRPHRPPPLRLGGGNVALPR